MESKVYPVLHYDIEQSDMSVLIKVIEQLEKFFERENIPFICLPKETNLQYMTKQEVINKVNKLMEYIETWE